MFHYQDQILYLGSLCGDGKEYNEQVKYMYGFHLPQPILS